MRKYLFPLLASLAIAAGPALAASIPASNKLAFDVIRKGKDIGDYVITFRESGSNLTVRLDTNIKVKVPIIGVSVYEFAQKSSEQWRSGKLAALSSTTNDNGEAHSISLGASSLLPASLWNVDIVKARSVLNTIDGKKMRISVRKVGNENVATGHGKVAASHYRISGDLARDVWYATDGTLVRVSFAGDDGSKVDYRLR
ncbi:MAG: hypothetical protein COC12_09085 [Rhodobacteraceae bacterium]|nr:MAG: hypothetical protein COC12_09085 [Paracoccaceae bacterium]